MIKCLVFFHLTIYLNIFFFGFEKKIFIKMGKELAIGLNKSLYSK